MISSISTLDTSLPRPSQFPVVGGRDENIESEITVLIFFDLFFLQVYGRGSGKECRQLVQSLNLSAGQQTEEESLKESCDDQSTRVPSHDDYDLNFEVRYKLSL